MIMLSFPRCWQSLNIPWSTGRFNFFRIYFFSFGFNYQGFATVDLHAHIWCGIVFYVFALDSLLTQPFELYGLGFEGAWVQFRLLSHLNVSSLESGAWVVCLLVKQDKVIRMEDMNLLLRPSQVAEVPTIPASIPSCDTHGCAILEELDYLCNLIGLQVQPHASSSDKDTSRT